MTARERTLAMFVGALAVGIALFVLTRIFLQNQRALTQQLAQKASMLAEMRTLISERDLWEQRDQWLQTNQPRLDNPDSAVAALLEQVKSIGQKHQLTPTDVGLSVTDPSAKSGQGSYEAVSVSFNLKGKREDLVDFLWDVQAPTAFLVLEKVTLQIDKEDKTLIGGNFKLAKWFAPK